MGNSAKQGACRKLETQRILDLTTSSVIILMKIVIEIWVNL